VPYAYWDRGYRQAFLGRGIPGPRDDNYGVRGAVRVV